MVNILCFLAAIIAFILILKWDVTDDYEKWKKELPVKHGKELIPRMLLLCIPGILFSIPVFPAVWAIITIPFMLGSWWFEFFDGWYNKKRGFAWRFNGSVDKDDAKTDKFLRRFSPKVQAIIKWSLITLFTVLYIILGK